MEEEAAFLDSSGSADRAAGLTEMRKSVVVKEKNVFIESQSLSSSAPQPERVVDTHTGEENGKIMAHLGVGLTTLSGAEFLGVGTYFIVESELDHDGFASTNFENVGCVS